MQEYSPDPGSVRHWRPTGPSDLLATVLAGAAPAGRPRLIAIDGRAGSGKTGLAQRLHALVPDSAVVHTDDFGWWQTFFGWDDLAIAHVLQPLHDGQPVAYRPASWDLVDRVGSLHVAAGRSVVFLEGAGAGRRSVAPWVDALIWVQADAAVARARGLARDGETAEMLAFWDRWQTEEATFLERERPWERATVVVRTTAAFAAGSPDAAVEIAAD